MRYRKSPWRRQSTREFLRSRRRDIGETASTYTDLYDEGKQVVDNVNDLVDNVNEIGDNADDLGEYDDYQSQDEDTSAQEWAGR